MPNTSKSYTTRGEPMGQCQATTAKGDQCQNSAQEGSDYCWITSHGEDVKECENSNSKRRKEWQETHYVIVSKYIQLMGVKKSAPTLQEVADAADFHINTVWKHVNEMDLSDHVEVSGARALTQDVIMGVAKAAMNGSSANAKLFMQIVHQWNEKKELDHISSDRSMSPPSNLKELYDAETESES